MIDLKSFLKKNKLIEVYLGLIIILSFLFTILEYINISYSILSNILFILNFILAFIYSYKSSLKTPLNGYKSGFRSGVKICIMFFIINFITLNKFSLKTLVYYIMIMLISITSGIFGKNKQKNYSS